MSFDILYEEDSSSPPSALDRRNVILSVDSHSGVLFARYKLLSAAGYVALSTTDGVCGLQIFGSYPVDLVLLNYVLPELDGGSVAHAMKEYEPNVPIIMLSGAKVPEQCLAAVTLYLSKGERSETLLAAIRELMASSIRIRVGWGKAE